MNENAQNPRGRPKTFDHDKVLQIAMLQYWAEDLFNVTINDICRLTSVSKPGVYRAFGSDDGLKLKVLEAYEEVAIRPLLDIFRAGHPFDAAIDSVISFMLQDRDALGIPKGCLFVMMRAQRQRLGPTTCEKLDQLRGHFLTTIEAWVDDLKSRGQFREDLPTNVAALFVDAQHAGAMRLQRDGVPPEQIDCFLRCGFEALRFKP